MTPACSSARAVGEKKPGVKPFPSWMATWRPPRWSAGSGTKRPVSSNSCYSDGRSLGLDDAYRGVAVQLTLQKEAPMLSNILSRYWWMTLLRGLVWILFGIAVLVQPGISLVTLTLLFGAFAFIDGIGSVVTAIGGRNDYENWWVLLLMGLAGIGVGVLTFLSPGTTALALLYYIAIWAIARGLLGPVTAIHLRKEIEGEFWLALAGLASIAFGVLLIARPGAGALAVLWLIGCYSIALGVILVILAFETRGFVNRVTTAVKGATTRAH